MAASVAYGVSFLLLAFRRRRNTLRPGLRVRTLAFAVVVHACFMALRGVSAGRPPFMERVELLSWFALCCALMCLVGSRWFRSTFVTSAGVLAAFLTTAYLCLSFEYVRLPCLSVTKVFLVWWPGFSVPLAFAALVLAYAAQLRGLPGLGSLEKQRTRLPMSSAPDATAFLSLQLVRFAYPLLASGLLAFGIGCLQIASRGWFWQRSIAAQLFVLVACTIILHLSASRPASVTRIFMAYSAAFCGVVVSVLSFDLPQGLLRGLGLERLP
ncbi:MAG: hypothetical protein V2A71_02400 [Candidatus Eisenbacteria bacterium]